LIEQKRKAKKITRRGTLPPPPDTKVQGEEEGGRFCLIKIEKVERNNEGKEEKKLEERSPFFLFLIFTLKERVRR
jgi:hypothetical protein